MGKQGSREGTGMGGKSDLLGPTFYCIPPAQVATLRKPEHLEYLQQAGLSDFVALVYWDTQSCCKLDMIEFIANFDSDQSKTSVRGHSLDLSMEAISNIFKLSQAGQPVEHKVFAFTPKSFSGKRRNANGSYSLNHCDNPLIKARLEFQLGALHIRGSRSEVPCCHIKQVEESASRNWNWGEYFVKRLVEVISKAHNQFVQGDMAHTFNFGSHVQIILNENTCVVISPPPQEIQIQTSAQVYNIHGCSMENSAAEDCQPECPATHLGIVKDKDSIQGERKGTPQHYDGTSALVVLGGLGNNADREPGMDRQLPEGKEVDNNEADEKEPRLQEGKHGAVKRMLDVGNAEGNIQSNKAREHEQSPTNKGYQHGFQVNADQQHSLRLSKYHLNDEVETCKGSEEKHGRSKNAFSLGEVMPQRIQGSQTLLSCTACSHFTEVVDRLKREQQIQTEKSEKIATTLAEIGRDMNLLKANYAGIDRQIQEKLLQVKSSLFGGVTNDNGSKSSMSLPKSTSNPEEEGRVVESQALRWCSPESTDLRRKRILDNGYLSTLCSASKPREGAAEGTIATSPNKEPAEDKKEPKRVKLLQKTIIPKPSGLVGPTGIKQKEGPKRERKKNDRWTPQETECLLKGVKRFGPGKWKVILSAYPATLSARTEVNLKDKWRNLDPEKGK